MGPSGAGTDQKRVVETTLRVRYAETDAMGVVYHANYFVWFEVGRGDWFRAFGQDYGEWEALGFFLPVSEAHARFHAPARYADTITVRTWIEEARSRSVTLGYEALDTDSQKRLASGWTKHICMDSEGQACRLPGDMQELLEQA
ncbi:MAG: YbgC/FadM family acyl-CoA thioesterase [Anaerolineae bacterium]|nr:YbgC/FadM family acyl-CoA thioesterase [Anaerolineae bacterium]